MYNYICDSPRSTAVFFMKAPYSFYTVSNALNWVWLIIYLRSTASFSPLLKKMTQFCTSVVKGKTVS